MKSISVSKVYYNGEVESLKSVFQHLTWHAIAESPWKADYPYTPLVNFQIAHADDKILLHYSVEEGFVKGQYIRPNENVWEDSCVEFFLSLDNKSTYYNFEFNVLGTGLIGYGSAVKSERNRQEAAVIEQVDTFTQVLKKDGKKTWEIYLAIPTCIIDCENVSGKVMHANFYKCGDNLPEPHFIAWNAIDFPKPNFHLPQFFGELNFE